MYFQESKNEPPLYPGTTKKKPEPSLLPPISGVYKVNEAMVDVEVKLDVDRIREYSTVLNTISGTIFNNSKRLFSWLKTNIALFFRSVGKAAVKKIEGAANNDTLVTSNVLVTFSDGSQVGGTFEMLLRLPQDDGVWGGNIKLSFGNSLAEFEGLTRQSSFFREVGLDVDYVEKVVFPTISLKDFHDAPGDLKGRKLDVFAVFEDAGVKIHYSPDNSNEISDPTPKNPWTKDDMYDVMMKHFDKSDRDVSIWCMIAKNPPDERYMGYSFEKNGSRGFGLFTGHKCFKGLFDSSGIEHAHASRRFLFYFVHEIGHTLGLVHPFDIGKPQDLSWMNYQWKYDAKYGPGEFYDNFEYSFTDAELVVIRHGPNKHFVKAAKHQGATTEYSKPKSLPISVRDDEEEGEMDGGEKEIGKLEFTIKIRPEAYGVGELVDLEARLKNKASIATVIDGNLEPEGGNVTMYVTYPDGNIKICESFLHYGDSSSMSQQIILYPPGEEQGSDRYSQLIQFGEGKTGPVFNAAGKYFVSAVYTGGNHSVVSNKLEVNVEGENGGHSDVNVATILGGSSHERFTGALDYWKGITTEEPKKQKSKVMSFIAMIGGFLRGDSREAETEPEPKRKKMAQKGAALTPDDVIKATDKLVKEYQASGAKTDNIKYKELVFKRGKILKDKGDEEMANAEFNQLLADLVQRGVKYSVIRSASNEWQTLSPTYKAAASVDKSSTAYLQNRVDEVLAWHPKKKVSGEDLSGIGLGNGFSNFDHDNIVLGMKVVRMLFNKYSETNDISAVLDYADTLQKGYQVNTQVLHWAVEVFVVHNRPAKKAGLLYPTPKQMDKSTMTKAAMFQVQRVGTPEENWINYWRSDADLNYHHRHWHTVYVIGRFIGGDLDWFGDWTNTRPELFRQGELFGYMHQQMLARYDAERESWGLGPVRPWSYTESDEAGFNAGFEFHNDAENASFSGRNPGSWSERAIARFRNFESVYNRAIRDGVLPPVIIGGQTYRVPMNANWAGHVIEASSQTWRTIGSIHNSGHGVFSSMSNGGFSYMGTTTTAMRDPIFYRWHKHVDNLWQRFADTQTTELALDAPDIVIRPSDVIMSTNPNPPNGFTSSWDRPFDSDEMLTYLGPAQKRYEWDNKISHAPFYYHIRFRRGSSSGSLNLTVRIFICPARLADQRKRWIEMDKFVFGLPEGQSSAVISRPDRHSSVIKRVPSEMTNNVESQFTTVQPGHCECGWPYSMLLPRGTAGGEQWRLCVFISDNNVDRIGITSSCGSMSFCGTSGAAFPDQRVMGYPFASDITINSRAMSIPQAMDVLPNSTIVPFVIRNDVSVRVPPGLTDIWTAWGQLNVNDGTRGNNTAVTFSTSRITGRMRVLIDDTARTVNIFRGVGVRFQGRGPGGGAYMVRVAHLGVRLNSTNNLSRPPYPLTVSGQTSFAVPEFGLVTDIVNIDSPLGDLFVTFTLDSPGCFLRGSSGNVSTYVIRNPTGDEEGSDNWDSFATPPRTSRSVYCISGVVSERR